MTTKNSARLILSRETLRQLRSGVRAGYIRDDGGTRRCPTPDTNGSYDCTGSNLNCTTSCGCNITV
jgi:hypothetical protein